MAPRPRGLAPSEQWRKRSRFDVVLTITTHRFVLFYKHEGGETITGSIHSNTTIIDARFVHLSNVKKIESTGGPSLMSPNSSYKIVLKTQTYDDLILIFRSNMGLGNSRSDRDQSVQELSKALERKRWEVATRLEEKKALEASKFNNLGTSSHKVGLDRILAKNKARHQQNAKLAEQALSGDSEHLLTEAAELLRVIQKYTVLVQKFEGNNSSNNDDEEAAIKLKGLLSDMGMTSGLSQSKMAGRGALGGFGNRSSAEDQRLRDYHEQTAREVADFLVPRLRKTGKGMMSLTDVYCLFNRARGTNLLSPEDLRDSCALLNEGLNVGLSQRTFPSGIVVLQLDDLALSATNYEARRKFIDLCTDENGKSALEASHSLQLSPLLAAEQLEEAERLGWLCRDATLSTVRFYPNKFVTTF
eukprot:CAMPEP_0168179292 /NCGR_PEP_ID=MMETSP0139_2-20121125/9745_1 /TAXON_ID=44445 /ORGANISM="Pseudo-nitzschia australis, Strain 10249 10 AB" /LENGTH=415 /DNA_ID=CAMNT_0008099071 /DNA_START=491 /DNA_END=1738 /DNA_ORIENTATION=-